VAVAVSHLGYTLAYWEVARPHDETRLGLPEAFRLVTTGFAPLSPRTGYSIDVWELTQRGVDRGAAECRIRLLGLLEYAVLTPAVFVAAWVMAARGIPAQAGLLPSWLIGVPAGVAVTAALLIVSRNTEREWWAPLRNQLDAIGDLLRLLRTWQRAPLAVVGMSLYWAAEISALACCLEIFAKTRGGIAAMIVGYATGYALTRRALPLAGAGVVEALMPFALNWVGYPLASATLAVISYRVFNMWLPMIPAVVALRRLEDDRASAAEAAEAAVPAEPAEPAAS
jgi:uncharacterized membrane protein YbhN (UPF0104 family)